MSELNFLHKLWLKFWPKRSSGVIAEQLRHPKGNLGRIVANKLNETNALLYDVTIDAMDLRDHSSVLELGFGNGRFFKKIFTKASDLKITGLDFSQLMVDTARKENSELIENGELNIVYSTCQALPFDADQFDKVFSVNVVYFWDDPGESLREIFRVLKPGGKFYTSIRLKETMQNFPYTQYGFTLYDEEEWKTLLTRHKFIYTEGLHIKEPDMMLDGDSFPMESICMVAQKPL